MNRYETIFIIDADVGTPDRKGIIEKMEDVIRQNSGVMLMRDDWGIRKLAYPIRKKMQGHYVRLDYCGTGDTVTSMERLFRQDFRVLRFMTVRTERNVDTEALLAKFQEGEEAMPSGSDEAQEPEISSDVDSSTQASEAEKSAGADDAPQPTETETEPVAGEEIDPDTEEKE